MKESAAYHHWFKSAIISPTSAPIEFHVIGLSIFCVVITSNCFSFKIYCMGVGFALRYDHTDSAKRFVLFSVDSKATSCVAVLCGKRIWCSGRLFRPLRSPKSSLFALLERVGFVSCLGCVLLRSYETRSPLFV